MSGLQEIVIHEIAVDGLPDMDALVGRVAFIFDGCIVSGWPLGRKAPTPPKTGPFGIQYGGDPGWPAGWEADSDVGNGKVFIDVTHWVEFPVPIWELVKHA